MSNRVGDTYFPGSSVPFNPINPFGAKAAYPKGWKNPMNDRLYQVFVEDRHQGRIPIGPKITGAVADQLCATVETAIKAGKITGWTNPHVSLAPAERLKGWAPV